MHHLLTASCMVAAVSWGVSKTWSALSSPGLNIQAKYAAARDVPVPGLRNIFRAGFEEPVYLQADVTGRRAWLRGKDDSGQAWDDLDHVFEMVAPRSFGRLVTTELSERQVRSGRRSLFMRQNVEEAGTQNRLQFFSDDATFNGELFTRRHFFVPARNLGYLSRHNDAVSIAGTREIRGGSAPPGTKNADFSMPLYLVRRGNNLVFAQAILDYSAGPNWSDWTRRPKGLLTYGNYTPVPLDRWFELDVYVLRHSVRGEIRVWLDGELILELKNVRTKNDTDRWFTKLADVDSEPAPFELWVDDVEIWRR